MSEKTFVYGGKQFIPVRQFHGKEGDFFAITRRLRKDLELGFFQEDYYGKGSKKADYSHESFYAASTDKNCDIFRCLENGKYHSFYLWRPHKNCDIFRCLENGKLYVPCEYELQEYMEHPQKTRRKDYER